MNLVHQRGTRQLDRCSDGLPVGNPALDARANHGFRKLRNQLLDEHVVVNRVSDHPADDADRDGQGRDSGNEVPRRDDGGDGRGGHDDAADAQAGDEENQVHGVNVVKTGGCEGAAAGCHDAAGEEDDPFDVAWEAREEVERDDAAG